MAATNAVLCCQQSRHGEHSFLQRTWGDTRGCHLFVSALIGRLEKGTSVR